MNTLRDALISCAAHIVPPHLQAIAQLSDVELVGMADIATERGSARAAEAGCPCFTDYHALLAQTCPVVVVVCMLHPLHGPLAYERSLGAIVMSDRPRDSSVRAPR